MLWHKLQKIPAELHHGQYPLHTSLLAELVPICVACSYGNYPDKKCAHNWVERITFYNNSKLGCRHIILQSPRKVRNWAKETKWSIPNISVLNAVMRHVAGAFWLRAHMWDSLVINTCLWRDQGMCVARGGRTRKDLILVPKNITFLCLHILYYHPMSGSDPSDLRVTQTKNNLILRTVWCFVHFHSRKISAALSFRTSANNPVVRQAVQTAAGESVWEKHWKRIASSPAELLFSHLHQRSRTSEVRFLWQSKWTQCT